MSHNGVSVRSDSSARGSNLKQKKSTEFSIDKRRRLVVVKFGTKINVEEIASYVKRLGMNEDFQPTFSEIIDLTELEKVDLNAEGFLQLADKIDPFAMEAKRAFVVRTSMQSHAARMHKILRNNRNIEIFHSLEEAERWLLL